MVGRGNCVPHCYHSSSSVTEGLGGKLGLSPGSTISPICDMGTDTAHETDANSPSPFSYLCVEVSLLGRLNKDWSGLGGTSVIALRPSRKGGQSHQLSTRLLINRAP